MAGFAFASEVTTLTGYGAAPLVVRPEMLSIETPTGADTPFQGIQLLPPAGLLAFDVATGSLVQRTWWTLEGLEPWQGDYRTALARLSTLLADRIPMRAPNFGDFALLLSGGLDSSVLAYLMRPQLCITVRYPGQDRLDESATAAVVARDIGAELVVVEPTAADFARTLPEIMHALDYPMGNASTFSEHMAYRAIAERGIRVAVGGLGPDEFLMGYVRHALVLFGPEAVLGAGLDAYRPLASKLLGDAGGALEPAEAIVKLILRGQDPDGRLREVVADALRRADGDLARGLTLADLATAWRPLVMTSDKLASAFALERRSPFLARDLVEFAYRLPVEHKIADPAAGKRILRDAAKALGLPREVWGSRDKLGFASPVPSWLSGPLEPWATAQISTALDQAPVSLRPLLAAWPEAGRAVRPHPHAGADDRGLVLRPRPHDGSMTHRRLTTVSAWTPRLSPPSRPPPSRAERSRSSPTGAANSSCTCATTSTV